MNLRHRIKTYFLNFDVLEKKQHIRRLGVDPLYPRTMRWQSLARATLGAGSLPTASHCAALEA